MRGRGGVIFGGVEQAGMGAGDSSGKCEEQARSNKEQYDAYNSLHSERCRGRQRESFCFRLSGLILHVGLPGLYGRVPCLVPPPEGRRV